MGTTFWREKVRLLNLINAIIQWFFWQPCEERNTMAMLNRGSQTLMCTPATWWSCQNANSSEVLKQSLRFCLFNESSGDANTISFHTTHRVTVLSRQLQNLEIKKPAWSLMQESWSKARKEGHQRMLVRNVTKKNW